MVENNLMRVFLSILEVRWSCYGDDEVYSLQSVVPSGTTCSLSRVGQSYTAEFLIRCGNNYPYISIPSFPPQITI